MIDFFKKDNDKNRQKSFLIEELAYFKEKLASGADIEEKRLNRWIKQLLNYYRKIGKDKEQDIKAELLKIKNTFSSARPVRDYIEELTIIGNKLLKD